MVRRECSLWPASSQYCLHDLPMHIRQPVALVLGETSQTFVINSSLAEIYWTSSLSLEDSSPMPVPETTSAEAFAGYVGGEVLRVGCRKAWREIQAWTMALPRVMDLPLPSASKPLLAWSIPGVVEFQERQDNRHWVAHRLQIGEFFLKPGGTF